MYLSSWVILQFWFAFLVTVALGMPSGKQDVPPDQVAVKDVAPVPQDQQILSMVDLEVRNRIFHCHLQLLSSDIKWKRSSFFFPAEK